MNPGDTSSHVAVIGGGIAGAFCAYHLARAGVAVTLIERDAVGAHASGANPGGLNPLHGAGIPGPMAATALSSFRSHLEHQEAIRELSGIDFAPRRVARVHLASTDEEAARLESMRMRYESTPGFAARWMERSDLLAMAPKLSEGFDRGLYTEGDARVEPAAYTRAVAEAAARSGARVMLGEVVGIGSTGRRLNSVRLDSGAIECDGAVFAVGPWIAGPARWLGARFSVAPVKGELLLVDAPGASIECDFIWNDAAIYAVGGARFWLGGTEDRVGLNSRPTPAARESILGRTANIIPPLSQARIVRQTAALRPVTPDGWPIVGWAPGWENVAVALGGGRKGMLLSAAMGLAAAELMTAGSSGRSTMRFPSGGS